MSTKEIEVMKQEKSESTVKRESPTRYTKAQILSSARYADRKDALGVLLDDKAYTFDEVNKLLDEFMKGKVK